MRQVCTAAIFPSFDEAPLLYCLIAMLIVMVLFLLNVHHWEKKSRIMTLREKEYHTITEQTIETFAKVIDAKDPSTNGHSYRVAHYSIRMGKKLGFSEKEQENLYYAALLHDIGKIGISDYILHKPADLTEEEYLTIKQHTEIGAEILKGIPLIEGLVVGAKYHHERYDGTGYMEGLKKDEIPLFARIIGLADSYDTMFSDRPYHKGIPREKIIDEIKRCSGSQFDPKLASIMITLIEEDMADDTMP